MVGSNLESEKMTDYITYLFKYFLTFHYFFFSGKTIFEINDNTVFGTKTTMRLLSGRPGGTFSDRPCYLCGGDNPVPRCSVGPLWQQPRKCLIFPSLRLSVTYVDDVFWGQPIKLIQVVLLHNFMNIDGMKLIIDFDFQVPAT